MFLKFKFNKYNVFSPIITIISVYTKAKESESSASASRELLVLTVKVPMVTAEVPNVLMTLGNWKITAGNSCFNVFILFLVSLFAWDILQGTLQAIQQSRIRKFSLPLRNKYRNKEKKFQAKNTCPCTSY